MYILVLLYDPLDEKESQQNTSGVLLRPELLFGWDESNAGILYYP
ncbi:MAG: hypothetical protein ACJAZM_000923 [Cyclobacteriaceae bacterium]